MSASFRSIVQQVTEEKLEELKIQKNLLTDHFQPVLNQIASPSITSKAGLQILYDAVQNNPVKDIIDATHIENVKYVLQNSNEDPSISSQLFQAWIKKLKQEIEYALRKCEYSYLYGSLLSEWLELEEKKRSKKPSTSEEAEKLDESSGSKDKVKQDKNATIDKIKELMFNQPSTDDFSADKFKKFLSEELFNFKENVEGYDTLKSIRKETEKFFEIENYYISSHDVQCCIKGLRSVDLLSVEKKEALKELSENSEALNEVASLLTNRLRNLSRWEWPSFCENVEIRRGLSGEYKPFMDENIITALFLQYVGVKWAAYFKQQFLRIYQSKIWSKKYCQYLSIESKRNEFLQSTFLSSLPDSMESQDSKVQEEYAKVEASASKMAIAYDSAPVALPVAGYGGAGAGYGEASGIMAPGAAYSGVSGSGGYPGIRGYPAPPPPPPVQYQASQRYHKPIPQKQASDIDFKQSFLHTLSTEIRLNQVIRPDKPFVVVQADLESFGPSIIHDAALIALEYFGVPKQWIEFFKKFMQPKICFSDSDDPKVVVRGVPTSHALSSLFGESLLFMFDFLVNQKCNGMRIYRISDEFWFWSDSTADITNAWNLMNSYGKMVGLKIKENRSGSVSIYAGESLKKLEDEGKTESPICGPAPLPQNNIHWGYLELHSNGVFKIDQKTITKFLKEMTDLFDKSECVLEWINVFNKYMAFFVRNFGKCALISGKQHLDQIISSLKKIYDGVFGAKDGGPIEKLKEKFEKLREYDIVDVWAYWPLEKGGLGLINPFVSIMSLRETYLDINDDDHFAKLPLQDKDLWEELKKDHERRYGNGPMVSYPGQQHVPKLPTWEEYVGQRETDLYHWYERYVRLLERPGPKSPNVSDSYWKLESPFPEGEERNYLMWLFTYYETQLILHFGSVRFINSKLLPMSMIASIQKSKVQH